MYYVVDNNKIMFGAKPIEKSIEDFQEIMW